MTTYKILLIAAACVLLTVCPPGVGQAQKERPNSPSFSWPEGKHGALSLSFDDARLTQIDNGLALFDRYGVKVTFYVSPDNVKGHLEGWKQAVAKGHEIGNHTLTHPCTGNKSFSRKNALEDLTLARIREEMLGANNLLKDLLGVTPKTFAYPCGQSFVGRGRNVQSYVPLVAELFLIGRGWLNEDPNDPLFFDMAQTLAVPSDRLDFDRIKPQIERSLKRGTWIVFAGHEIANQDRQFTTRISMLEDLLRYVQDPANGVWVDTVQNIASYIVKQRETSSR
jgi:peptidoglycan/xylan/chitin deacetylase (PgdA/CDA1 family)